MSGPFTNSIAQLAEQINWVQTDEKLTWDNLRYGFFQDALGVNGELHVAFSSQFPREILGFGGTLDFAGGVRNWIMGFKNVTTIGFTAVVGLAGSWGLGAFPASGTIVGVHYLAFGR